MKYKKGDKVKIWSLQSWNSGGFLNGVEAVVIQNQVGDAVQVAVVRNFDGKYKLDECYEIYAQQCQLADDHENNRDSSFKEAYAAFKELVHKLRH